MIPLFARRLGPDVLMMHSMLRWAIIILMVILLVRGLVSLVTRDPLETADRLVSLATVLLLDLQMLAGIALWLFRYYAIEPEKQGTPLMLYEHPAMMLGVIVLAHISHVLLKKEKRVPAMLMWMTTAIALLLAVSRMMTFRF